MSESQGLPVTLRAEQLIAEVIRQALPDEADNVIEGADQTANLPHPVYISVMAAEDGTRPDLPTGPIYKVPVDIIRMAHYKASTHENRKIETGKIQGIFKASPEAWMMESIVPGILLKGWFIESVGGDDVGDYVGDGMRLVCAVLEAEPIELT